MFSKLFLSKKNQLWVTWGRVAKAKFGHSKFQIRPNTKQNEKANGNKYQKGQIWLICLLKRSNGDPDSRASVNVLTKIIFKLIFNFFPVEKCCFLKKTYLKVGWQQKTRKTNIVSEKNKKLFVYKARKIKAHVITSSFKLAIIYIIKSQLITFA